MSILIKGMEMPTCCMFCPLSNSCGCGLTNPPVLMTSKEMLAGRPDWCPLVPIPPHGDLIDRDALMKILSKVIDINASIEQRNEATDQERRCLWWFEQQIGIAPTIIPAEEGE